MSKLIQSGYCLLKKTVSKKELDDHKKRLKIIPYVPNQEFYNQTTIYLWKESKNYLILPRYYATKYYEIPPKDNIFIKRNYHKLENIPFNGHLRDYQIQMVKTCTDALKTNGGGVLSISPGMGKTCCALYIISKLKTRTLIIVHTSTLLNQWQERINEFLPNAKIGIVRQNKIETDISFDISIAMVQSLSLKEYEKGIFNSFEMVIYDEIDRMCTNIFSKSFPKVSTKYTFGLSATPYREDKCEKIFEYYIGPIVHYEKRPPDNTVKVESIYIKYDNFEPDYDKNGDISYTKTVIKLSNNEYRNNIIVDKIISIMKTQNRKILVLSAYINQLKTLNSLFESKNVKFSHSLYIGPMKENERKISQNSDVMLGTYSLASVGMDIPALNTLILATPRKQIEQSVGRIMRKNNTNTAPLIIDIIDSFYFFINQSKKRNLFYKQYGYTINNIYHYENELVEEEIEYSFID